MEEERSRENLFLLQSFSFQLRWPCQSAKMYINVCVSTHFWLLFWNKDVFYSIQSRGNIYCPVFLQIKQFKQKNFSFWGKSTKTGLGTCFLVNILYFFFSIMLTQKLVSNEHRGYKDGYLLNVVYNSGVQTVGAGSLLW